MAKAAFTASLNPAGTASAAPIYDAVEDVISTSAAAVVAVGDADTAVGAADTAVGFSDTAVDDGDAAIDAAKVLTAALETDAVAADGLVDTAITGEPDDAAVITALGVLQADGASPTEAHVDDLQTAWDAFKSDFDAYVAAVGDVKTATAALETDTIAADTAVDDAVAASQAAQAASALAVTAAGDAVTASAAAVVAADATDAAVTVVDGLSDGGVALRVDLTAVPTVSKLRKLFNSLMPAALASGRMTE